MLDCVLDSVLNCVIDCVVNSVLDGTTVGGLGFEIGFVGHCCSSEPSTQFLTPLHLPSLLIQAPYLHLNVYFGHLIGKIIKRL